MERLGSQFDDCHYRVGLFFWLNSIERKIIPLILFLTATMFFSSHVWAEEWVTAPEGCRVVMSNETNQEKGVSARWFGSCRDGYAEGTGTLTSSIGTFYVGEFRDGGPYDALGQELVVLKQSQRTIALSAYKAGRLYNLVPIRSTARAQPLSTSKVIGNWIWKSNDELCQEEHRYSVDGALTEVSAAQETNYAYSVYRTNIRPERFAILIAALRTNGKLNCRGKKTEIDSSVSTFDYIQLLFDGPDRYRTCRSEEELSCYGYAVRKRE